MGPGPGPGLPQVDAVVHRKESFGFDFGSSNAVIRSDFCQTACARMVAGFTSPSGFDNSTSRPFTTLFGNGAEKSSLQRFVGHVAPSSMVPSSQVDLVSSLVVSKLETSNPSKLGEQRACTFNVPSLAHKTASEAQTSSNISAFTTPFALMVSLCSDLRLQSLQLIPGQESHTCSSVLLYGTEVIRRCRSFPPTHTRLLSSVSSLDQHLITYLLLIQCVDDSSVGPYVSARGTCGLVVSCSSVLQESSVIVVKPSFITRMFYMLLLASFPFLLRFWVLLGGSRPCLGVRP